MACSCAGDLIPHTAGVSDAAGGIGFTIFGLDAIHKGRHEHIITWASGGRSIYT